ncbi:tetratricopeptide repeat protein [Mariprofundus erugo]|uniref:Tetratricopeptide repeat protein n=1 Tax=Mariprofundus erugo TaxID=2528639 RepID=A0A5R9GYB5_9PROT|nr:tetratricopeptide repeat protein [Mariprofundus erugo]TLS69063.1 tetratricopeptide repeat protein [Mariprofundus erugo]
MNKLFLYSLPLLWLLTACGEHQSLESQPAAQQKPATSQSHTINKAESQAAIAQMEPDFLYLAALNALRDGNREMAIELLTALIKKDPGAAEPHLQLVSLLMQSGRIDEAEQHIATLLSGTSLSDEERQQLQLAQYRIYIARGDTAMTLEKLEGFLHNHPDNDSARSMQATIFASQGQIDKALASVAAGIRIKESSTLRMLEAQLLVRKGDLTNARISLMRMRKLMPDNDAATLILSDLASKSNNRDEAEKLLQDFLLEHPADMKVTHALARLLIEEKRLTEAILIYRNAAAHSGNSPEALRPLGMLYFQHGDYKLAEQTFRQLLEMQPDDNNRYYLAASLEALEQFDEAQSQYEKIRPDTEMGLQAQIRLAAMDIHRDHMDQAEVRLLSILKQRPNELDAHLLLSSIRLSKNQFRQLLDETEALLELQQKLPPQLLFNRAVAFEHFKDYARVESTLNRVLAHNPKYADALNFLGYTFAEQGIQLDRAKELILRALQEKPDDGYYLDSLAWVYYKLGDFGLAVSTQEKAIQQIANDTIMHEHYGDMLWQAGRSDAARQAWHKALELNSDHPKELEHKIKHGLQSGK